MPEGRVGSAASDPSPTSVVDLIVDETAAYFGVTADEVRSRHPGESAETATRIAMHLIRQLSDLSLVKIAEVFRGADVDLIRAACDGVTNELADHGNTFHFVHDLTRRIRRRELTTTFDNLTQGIEQIGRQLGPIIGRSEVYARELTNDLSALDEIRLKLQELLGVVDRLLSARKLAEEIKSASERLARSR